MTFPAQPDWSKVEKATLQILDVLEISGLSFIDKYNIIKLVESEIDREFTINFFTMVKHSEVVEEQKVNIRQNTPGIQ